MSGITSSGEREVPRNIGKYEILKRIAVGGMAEVFLGRVTREGGFEKLMAIKRVHPDLAAEGTFTDMFIDEARITAGLNHSNIAQIYDFGRSGNSCFQAIEFIPGVDLTHILAFFLNQNRVPPPSLVAFIMAKVCSALEYAHAKCDNMGRPLRIIHRDVSPGNVLVSFEGEIKLIDFGVAKATRRTQETAKGILKGKVAFMSPEQVKGKPLDHRSDIFSAGIMMYELLTGHHPFRTDDDIVTLELIRAGKAPPPSTRLVVPEDLEQICLKALAPRLSNRYPNAGQMERELDEFRSANPLSRQKVAAWMKKSFQDQLDELQKTLSVPPPGIQKSPTFELDDEDLLAGEGDQRAPRSVPRPAPEQPDSYPQPASGPMALADTAFLGSPPPASVDPRRASPGPAPAPSPAPLSMEPQAPPADQLPPSAPAPRSPAPRSPAPRSPAPRSPAPRSPSPPQPVTPQAGEPEQVRPSGGLATRLRAAPAAPAAPRVQNLMETEPDSDEVVTMDARISFEPPRPPGRVPTEQDPLDAVLQDGQDPPAKPPLERPVVPTDPGIPMITEPEDDPREEPPPRVISMGGQLDEELRPASGWWKVVLGVLFAAGVAGALGYQIYYMLKRGPKMVPVPAASRVVEPDEEPAADPRLVIITVTADDISGKCRARIADSVNESQVLPCRFKVPQGKDFKLRVTYPGHKPLLMHWRATADRVLEVQKQRRGKKVVVSSDSRTIK